VQRDQAVSERHADIVLEFEGRGAGSTLGAVHDDEVGRHILGRHRLADAEDLGA